MSDLRQANKALSIVVRIPLSTIGPSQSVLVYVFHNLAYKRHAVLHSGCCAKYCIVLLSCTFASDMPFNLKKILKLPAYELN